MGVRDTRIRLSYEASERVIRMLNLRVQRRYECNWYPAIRRSLVKVQKSRGKRSLNSSEFYCLGSYT